MMLEFAMYYLSYLPLWVSIIIKDSVSISRNNDNLWTEYITIPVVIFVIAICLAIVFGWINKKEKQNIEAYTLKSAKEERFVTAEFLMSYVLPLYAFEFTQWDGMVLFALFFAVFWFIVDRHKYFCSNLALEIAKYTVYECELEKSGQTISKKIVSRRELPAKKGETIRTRKYNNDYHFEVKV